jgi:hypothetical protein
MRRFLVPCGLAAVCALAGVQFAAGAPAQANTTVGPLAGNGNFTVNTRSASSSCPTRAVVTGLQVAQERRGFIGAVAVICTAPNGTVTTGSVIGDTGVSQSTASCNGTKGLGIYGYTGDIVNGVGIRCGAAGGTATNGPLVWSGRGGAPNGPYDCSVGSALTGLTGTYARYFGGDVVVSLTGICTAVVPTSKAQCKHGGWRNFTAPSFKNQGQCVSWFEHHVRHHGKGKGHGR